MHFSSSNFLGEYQLAFFGLSGMKDLRRKSKKDKDRGKSNINKTGNLEDYATNYNKNSDINWEYILFHWRGPVISFWDSGVILVWIGERKANNYQITETDNWKNHEQSCFASITPQNHRSLNPPWPRTGHSKKAKLNMERCYKWEGLWKSAENIARTGHA